MNDVTRAKIEYAARLKGKDFCITIYLEDLFLEYLFKSFIASSNKHVIYRSLILILLHILLLLPHHT